ncbi:LOW QUALITY PROTEIN: uncharacterized protein [Panulirus ornatus]|uniref:LOW QUALITY PROTEIN: uncharacterized protein n=1 Tax=Panulirus ornatus TaxID=150431 RepID=UPI003A83A388
MDLVAAEDYYSVLNRLKDDVIQSNSAAFSSIIEKYICLSHGLEPPETDIENFYGGSCARKKHLLKFLEQHKPDRNTPPKHSINSRSPGNQRPSDILDDDFSQQIQETLRKRKVQLGLPEDSETCEVWESESDDESLVPNNNYWQKSYDAIMIDEKREKRIGRKTAEVNCCYVRSGENVPGRMKLRERRVPSQDQEENASRDEIENASQEKEEEVERRNTNRKISQNDEDFNVKQVCKTTDTRSLMNDIRIKLKRIDALNTTFECENPKTRIMKRDNCFYIKEVQKDTQSILQEKEREVNVLHETMENISQNEIKKAPQVIKEVYSKEIDKVRKTKIKFGNNEVNASTNEKENASQDKNEVLLERTDGTRKKVMYEKSVLTPLERNNCSQRKPECSYAQPKISKGDKSFDAKKTQNDSVKVNNSTMETLAENCKNGGDKVCQKKVTGCKDDTNLNERRLSDKATKPHLNKNACDDPLKTTKELIDARPGNNSVVLTKYGDTIFLPPLAQHEEDVYTSSMRILSRKDNYPVFFVTFNAQDTEASQPIRSPLNDASTEPVTVNGCQKESKTVVTPQEKSHSYTGDKSVRKNAVTEEVHKKSQDEDGCTSTLVTAIVEPVTEENCERDSSVTMTPHSHQDDKSKSTNKVLEEMYKNSQKIKLILQYYPQNLQLSVHSQKKCILNAEMIYRKLLIKEDKVQQGMPLTKNGLQSPSLQKLLPAGKRQTNNTSFSEMVLCSQLKDVSHSQKAKALLNVMSPQHQSPSQKNKTLANEKSPQHQSPSQEGKTLVSERSLRHQSPSQEEKTMINQRSPRHQSPSQEGKTMVNQRSPRHQSPPQERKTMVNQRSPQHQSQSQEGKVSFIVSSSQHKRPSQKMKISFNVRSPQHKSPSQKGTSSFNVRSPQQKSPSQKGKPVFNVRSPQNKNQSQNGKILLLVRSPKRKSSPQKEKSLFNARSPKHKSPSQNITFLKPQYTGLKKRLWRDDTSDTFSKRVREEVDNERSDVMHKCSDGGAQKISGSLTFCKDNISQSARKPVLKRNLSLSKGRIVLEFFDRSAHRKKMFGILEDNRSLHENGKEFRGEKVNDDSKRQVGTDASGVSYVKSPVTSNSGEICQEQGSKTKKTVNKGETKDLSTGKWQNCEESIIAGIDAVKKKRKSLSYGHSMDVHRPKGFVKSVHGEQNGLVRSISVVPEISSIVEDVTVPLLSSTRSEMLNVLPVPGVQQRQRPIPQNEYSQRRKAEDFSSLVVAKKPKLDEPLQMQKNCSPESKSVTLGRLKFVGSTSINNSVPSGKQSDAKTSEVRNAFSKDLTDNSKKRDKPSHHTNNSDSDEELSLLPVEHSSLAAGPHQSSLYTVSKLWSTLRNSQLQNTQMDRFQTKVSGTNSTADSNASYATKMHKNSKTFWEIDSDEETKSYPLPLASHHKHSSTVMKQSSSCFSQNSTANLSADTSSIPSYRVLGGERWLAAVRSVKRHRKPIFLGASFSFTKNKR